MVATFRFVKHYFLNTQLIFKADKQKQLHGVNQCNVHTKGGQRLGYSLF